MSLYKDASLVMIPTAYKDGKLYSIRPVPEYGSEQIENGDFATDSNWTKGSGWTISGGTANATSASTGTPISQYIDTGKKYRVTYDVVSLSQGAFQVDLSYSGTALGQLATTTGTYTDDITSINPALSIRAVGTTTGSVDNVSVQEIVSSGDFTFSRGSNLAATRVDVNGLIEKGRENLYTQSNNFSHSDWTPKAGTFVQGVADPNGGTDAWSWTATNTDPFLYQNKSISGVYCLSIYVKGVGSTIGEDFQIRVGAALKDVTLTGDWQRVQHFGVLSGSTNIGFEYGNPATANDVVHIYAAQLEQGLVATDYIETGASTAQAGILEDMPRLDYSGSCPSLLLEPQRTNSATHSEYLGSWSISNATQSFGVTSPEGVDNAYSYVTNSNISSVSTGITIPNDNNTHITSIFVKNVSGYSEIRLRSALVNGTSVATYSIFDLSSGTKIYSVQDGGIEDYGNGWYRIWNAVTNNTSGNTTLAFQLYLTNDSNQTNEMSVFGAQAELNCSYPTSYIPTYGTSQTRSVDDCSATGISSVIGQTQGVIFMDFIWSNSSPTGGDYALMVYGANTADFVSLNANGNNNQMLVYSGGSAVAAIGGGSFVVGQRYKIALVYRENYFAYYINGVLKGTDTSGAVPNNLQSVRTRTPFGLKTSSQKTQQLVFFPTALTDSECIALTTL